MIIITAILHCLRRGVPGVVASEMIFSQIGPGFFSGAERRGGMGGIPSNSSQSLTSSSSLVVVVVVVVVVMVGDYYQGYDSQRPPDARDSSEDSSEMGHQPQSRAGNFARGRVNIHLSLHKEEEEVRKSANTHGRWIRTGPTDHPPLSSFHLFRVGVGGQGAQFAVGTGGEIHE